MDGPLRSPSIKASPSTGNWVSRFFEQPQCRTDNVARRPVAARSDLAIDEHTVKLTERVRLIGEDPHLRHNGGNTSDQLAKDSIERKVCEPARPSGSVHEL